VAAFFHICAKYKKQLKQQSMKYHAPNTVNSNTSLNGAENLATLCHYSPLLGKTL
jgi:hypothetical protein|tara:strand:- start:1129 stop:1293 length:165 start_codon:yes stop_codon:yes gene_type:complete